MDDFEIPLVVTFQGDLDSNGDIKVSTADLVYSNYLTKDKAEELVDHLNAVFGLMYKKEEPSEK